MTKSSKAVKLLKRLSRLNTHILFVMHIDTRVKDALPLSKYFEEKRMYKEQLETIIKKFEQ